MLSSYEEVLKIGNEIWTFQSVDVHLYQLAIIIELPSQLLVPNPGDLVSTEEDWSRHFSSILHDLTNLDKLKVVLPLIPMRVLVIYHALRKFIESLEQDDGRRALVTEWLIELEINALDDARRSLHRLLAAELLLERGGPVLRLSLHLSGVAELQPFSAIPELDLTGEHYSDTFAQRLSLFSKMRKLKMSRCGLIDESLAFLSHMPDLEELDLSSNAISSIGLEMISKPASLQSLDISATNSNRAACLLLRKMINLKNLALPAQWFDSESVASLQNSLPNCQIKTV